jgi:tetratricopeptide (TPR) repeat protein
VLNARDRLQTALKDKSNLPTQMLIQVIKLDGILREKTSLIKRILQEKELLEWRESMSPPAGAWWWQLDQSTSPHPFNRLDGLWTLLMIAGWTANITLLVNLATRFLGGGVGLAGVAAITLPSILALLQVGSEFTKTGHRGVEKFLATLGVPQELWEEAKLTMTLLLSIALCLTWLHLPNFSKGYNYSGIQNYRKGNLGEAEKNFLRAISLDADNFDAHYNLGSLYDRLQQFDAATKEYLIAIAGGLPDAYNNLARLYIKDKKYDQAAALLSQGIEQLDSIEFVDPKVRYDLYKNFGWVRLEQKRYEEAKEFLQIGIVLAQDPETAMSVNPSAAYCLLAQVLDKQKQLAVEQWTKCQQLGSVSNPDEDPWLYQAKQKLRKTTK